MTDKLKTVLVGFGRIGAGYASDPKMAKYFRYATHAQVLQEHPKFSFEGIIDPREDLSVLARQWNVERFASSFDSFEYKENVDVLVLATPPEHRLSIISQFPNLKAVILEKPIASNMETAVQLMEYLCFRKILTQVNLMRRADVFTRSLAKGGLEAQVGVVQAVFGQYGNGLRNNGTHIVDLLRMIFGEVESVQALNVKKAFAEGPLNNDLNVSFEIVFKSGELATIQPLKFRYYRENALQFWGAKARLDYMHGGITIMKSGIAPNRMLSTENELAVDSVEGIESTLGHALYQIYSNLSAALSNEEDLFSPIESALETQRVIEAICDSVKKDGTKIDF